MKEEQLQRAYEDAKAQYAALGVDVDQAIEKLNQHSISFIAGRQMMFQDLRTRKVN